MIRFYITLILGVLAVLVVAYSVYSYMDGRTIVQDNKIIELEVEKNNLEVKQIQKKVQNDFKEIEKKIKRDSNTTRVYTKTKMEDEDVQDFDDSW